MLEFSHNPWLVIASLAVAMMAGFTGLSLTRGASALGVIQRKQFVVLAAIVLGGGIWSMHFVAMLGLQLPILFYYDTLITLISALVAILMVGLALLVLHFLPRSPMTIVSAGAIVGLGISTMHFIGMAGMQLCRPEFGVLNVVFSTLAALLLSILAIWVAYDARTHRNILLGTVCFGLAVFAVHFVAMAQTSFFAIEGASGPGPLLSNQNLAVGVTLSAFLICGAFLLTGVSFIGREAEAAPPVPDVAEIEPIPVQHSKLPAGIPYEKDGQVFFAQRGAVAAVRAEGHYTLLYVEDEKLFCPWSITDAEARLVPAGFIRSHRSYLINPTHVSRFERNKDTGTCYFEAIQPLAKVPVSRSRLADVRHALGV